MDVPTATDLWAVAGGPATRLAAVLDAVAEAGDTELTGLAELLLGLADARLWLSLDVAVRRLSWYPPVQHQVLVGRVRRGELGRLGLILAACNGDGHVREAAVERLAELGASPVLALRAADWVPQVRERARLACQRWLDASSFGTLAPVAVALRDRLEGRWLVSALESLLREGSDAVLAAGLTSEDGRVRRLAYSVGIASDRFPVEQLVRIALTDGDLSVRVAGAEAALGSGDPEVPHRLLRSRTAAIRADALHRLGLAGFLEPAWNALLDRSAVVRATACAALRRAGHSPVDRYRELVGSSPPAPAALAGLGETGTASDAVALRAWLRHPAPRGRAEAVRALRRLGDTPVDLLVPLLRDPSPPVVRQVVAALRPQVHRIGDLVLHGLLGVSQPPHVRLAAFGLLQVRDPWTRLATDLMLLDDPLLELRSRAKVDIGNWLAAAATFYARPTPDRARELTKLLSAAIPILGKDRARQLMFHIGLGR